MSKDYDQALFEQLLRKRAKNNQVTRKDVEDVFWVVCWDLAEALYRQGNEERAREYFRGAMLQGIINYLHDTTELRVK